jgi:hypothetical protein
MSLLYTSRIIPTTATATSAASGYAATNVLLQALGAPWRSTSTALQDVVIDLGSAQTPRGIGVQDTNATSIVIASSADNITYTDRATLDLTNVDRFNRRRGCAGVNTSARYWRLRIASATAPDGLAYWRIGAVYVFGAVTDVIPPQYGFSVRSNHNESREQLANGREAIAAIGSRADLISGKFGVQSTGPMVIGSLLADLRTGSVWLDMQVTARPSWTWPLINAAGSDDETMDMNTPDYTTISLNAREVVG